MKNTVILLFAKMFEKGIMFLFFILLANSFGKTVLGEFSYYFSIVTILFVLFDLGGDFYQIKEFSRSENLQKFNTIFVLKTFIFIFIFIGTYFINSNVYMLLFLISYYLASILSIFRSSLYNNGQYILEAKYTILEKFIFLIIIVLNVVTIENLLVIYLSFLVSKSVYLFILVHKFYKLHYILSMKKLFNLTFAKQYIFGSWSYILHALLVVIFVQIDIIMLKHMGVSYEDIGLYSVALKVYAIAIIFADVLFKQYYPIVAKYIQNDDATMLKPLILKIQNTNLFFSIYFTLLIILFSKEIIYFGFGEEFNESSKMLIMLSIVVIFRFSMYTYTSILSASNLNYIKLYTSIVCVTTNIVLNYVLIPIYGVYGAIVATIITEILLVVLYKVSSFKIIFTNYLTMQEVFAVLITIGTVFFFFNTELEISIKLIIFSIILLSLVINYRNIKHKLTFKKEENV